MGMKWKSVCGRVLTGCELVPPERAKCDFGWLVELYLHMTRGRDSSLPIAPCCHSLAMPVSIWDEGSLVIREFHKQLDVGRYRM
eukprot:6940695-Pyramimonas_sp.AAC.1